MRLKAHTEALFHYAPKAEWEANGIELASRIIAQIAAEGPSERAWAAILELMQAVEAAQADIWVAQLEPALQAWPVEMRRLPFAHPVFKKGRQSVYALVGELQIKNVDDSSGQSTRRWADQVHWRNLHGLNIRQMETEPAHLARLFASLHLQQLKSLSLIKVDGLHGALATIFPEGQMPHLSHLAIRDCGLRGQDWEALAGLKLLAQLDHLDVRGNSLSENDCLQLMEAKAEHSIAELMLK